MRPPKMTMPSVQVLPIHVLRQMTQLDVRVLDEVTHLMRWRIMHKPGAAVWANPSCAYLAAKTGWSVRSVSRAIHRLKALRILVTRQCRSMLVLWRTNLFTLGSAFTDAILGLDGWKRPMGWYEDPDIASKKFHGHDIKKSLFFNWKPKVADNLTSKALKNHNNKDLGDLILRIANKFGLSTPERAQTMESLSESGIIA